ncbi:acyltransferase [Stieleria sp. TO1_6]|uniref:acyltransferase n=1 Tax=Stieleria tagensis TaxID=2956795 RepID=UPI00209B1112|nr:acyltransferase [Stieleria tagensis]MCO8121616.1 acyltransferase [Stieleria tagensis]
MTTTQPILQPQTQEKFAAVCPPRRRSFPTWKFPLLIPWWIAVFWKKTVSWGWQQRIKSKLASIGDGCRLRGTSLITAPDRLWLGDNVHIGDNSTLRAEGGLQIDSHAHLARNVVIYTINHNYEGTRIPYDETVVAKPVKIGIAAWIGINVIILPGVEIGEGAIIGAGSVVTHSIPALSIAAGNPCRVVKQRDSESYYQRKSAKNFGGVNGIEYRDRT